MFDRKNIIISLLTILSIENIRLWIVRNFFHTEQQRSFSKMKLYLWWVIIIATLLGYGYINWWQDALINARREKITIFIGYCAVISSFIYITKHRGNSYYKQLLMISTCLFAIAAYSTLFVPMQAIIAYVLISVYAEEYMKIHASTALVNKQSYVGRDLIFFALVMWLWFSLVEHIAYLIHHINTQGWTLRGMHIARWLLTTSIHMVASGIIAYMTLRGYSTSTHSTRRTIAGILLAIGLHMIYNLSIHFGYITITVITTILSYYILSFLLYQTNILYQKTK
jgi:RsiW-degrading membrane proteinase PrsW (M82 family)